MADAPFDDADFTRRLGTRAFGRALTTRDEVGSTNDVAWEAHAGGAPHGAVVIAAVQTRGRGRAGRRWETPRGGLALSLLLSEGCNAVPLHVLPLAAGVALAEALERFGAAPALKWPNDVLIGGRKVAGLLIERRGVRNDTAVVVGVGVNVTQGAEALPAVARDDRGARHDAPTPPADTPATPATSLVLEGVSTSREAVAAAFLDALERAWHLLGAQGAAPVIEAWRARARFWGEPVRVRGAGGVTRGVARSLDEDGRLVLDVDGAPVAILAGDLELGVGEDA